jgi:hypothetical protein
VARRHWQVVEEALIANSPFDRLGLRREILAYFSKTPEKRPRHTELVEGWPFGLAKTDTASC